MSSISAAIHENSEKFLPAFARLKPAGGNKMLNYSPLDFRFTGTRPEAAQGERALRRWVVVGRCIITVSDLGTPIDLPDGPTSGKPVLLFQGGGEFLLTDRRLLAVIIKGETIIGDINERSGSVLIVSFPLTRVEAVNVDLKKRMFGGLKETSLHIWSSDRTVADLIFDDVVAEADPGSPTYHSFEGSKRQIVEAFVDPVIAARRPSADIDERQQLTAVENGARQESADEFGVQFVSG